MSRAAAAGREAAVRIHALVPLLAAVAIVAAGCGHTAADPCKGVKCGAGQTCSKGKCVARDGGAGCTGNTDCGGTTPVCDPASHACVACAKDADCGAGKVCASDGSCADAPVACVSDADCQAVPGRTHCDTVNAKCVACTQDSQCTGLGQICNRGTGTCMTPTSCTSDADCVNVAGMPRCDSGSGTCVACLADADCDTAAKQTCDTSTHTCQDFVPCQTDLACANDPNGPHCDTSTGACVACTKDADCVAGAAQVCLNDTCQGGMACTTDADCTDLGAPRCDPALGLCVACLASSDCPQPGSTCDTQQRTCRTPIACTTGADCTDPATPICDTTSGYCVGCLADTDCTTPGAACIGGICDSGPPTGGRAGAACATMDDCTAASAQDPTQYQYWCLQPGDSVLPWQWYQGYCIGFCQSQADCPGGATCLGGACWDTCQSDADCRAGYACQQLQAGTATANICAPVCDPAIAATMTCQSDSDCGLGVCDGATGHCACSDVGGRCGGLGYCRPGAGCISPTDANGNPTGWAGGYCIIFNCAPPQTPCPDGSSCYTVATDGTTACLKDCDPNVLGSCSRAAYGCTESDRYVIGGACSTDADCPTYAPHCQGAAAGGGGTCIRPCQTNADCDTAQGHICRNIQGGLHLCADPFQGGACFPACKTDADCGRCATDAECPTGQTCSGEMCRIPCNTSTACTAGQVCQGGFCATSCTDDTDCPRGASCSAGACTVPVTSCDPVARRCTVACQTDLDCDRSRTCDPATGRCYTACSAPTDNCGPAGQCDAAQAECKVDCRKLSGVCAASTYCDPDTGDCLERCGSFGNGTCAADEVCDPLTGSCGHRCDANLGATCQVGSDCTANQVCWDGHCADRCAKDTDCTGGNTCLYSYVCQPCPSSRSRCDTTSGVCFACLSDAECGTAYYCATGTTWKCTARCGGVSGGTGTCAQGTLCDVDAGGKCVAPCTSDADCTGAARPHCETTSGLCGQCATNADCAGAAGGPACDTASRTCVACTADGDCTDPALPACDTLNHVCVACTKNADCVGSAAGPVCDTSKEQCVECMASSDCPSTHPTCDTTTQTCQPCTSDADCTTPGDVCHTALNGGDCRPPCGNVPGSVNGTPFTLGAGATFDDGTGTAVTISPFRLSDDVWAFSASGGAAATADLQGFPLNVPSGATVTGIEVDVEASTDAAGTDGWQVSASLLDPSTGTPTAAQTDPTVLDATDAVHVLGGASNLWGASWTPTTVNDVNFGVRVSVASAGASPSTRARIDQVVLVVHFTTIGGTDCAALNPSLTCNAQNRCQ